MSMPSGVEPVISMLPVPAFRLPGPVVVRADALRRDRCRCACRSGSRSSQGDHCGPVVEVVDQPVHLVGRGVHGDAAFDRRSHSCASRVRPARLSEVSEDASGISARRRGVRHVGRCSRSTGRSSSPPVPSRSSPTGSAGRWSRWSGWSCVFRRTPQLRAIIRDRRLFGLLHRGVRGDRPQLGRLHLRRQQRSSGRGVARLLHQPARDRAARRDRARRTPAPAAVGGDRHRRRSR